MTHWKTTTAGIAAILSALGGGIAAALQGHPVDWNLVATAVVAGIGLIAAADSSKVSK